MMKYSEEWEQIATDTERLKVIGGWLIRLTTVNQRHAPNHVVILYSYLIQNMNGITGLINNY